MDYPYIVAWHALSGSLGDYIDQLVERARSEHAPPTAIYRDPYGQWRTFEEVMPSHFRDLVAAKVSELTVR